MLRTDPAPPRRRPTKAGAVGAVLLLPLLAGCGAGFGGDDPLPDQTVVVAPSGLPVPVPSEARVGASGPGSSPSGEPTEPDGAVLAVVVDGSPAAGVPVGLEEADVVYVGAAEGGPTRFLALFRTEVPTRIGPVGPAAADDVALLRSHGDVALAVTDVEAAEEALAGTDLQVVSLGEGAEGFSRDPERDPASDVMADGPALLDRAPGATGAQDLGLGVGPSEGDPVTTAAGSYAWPTTTVTFSWSEEDDAWRLQRDGEAVLDEAGEPVRTDNVLFTDAPDASAEVTLLRDGTAVEGRRDDLRLDVGATWVVLMADGDRPTLTGG